MKQLVLSKTASFHPLLKKRRGKAQNGFVLNGTISLLLPLNAQRRGKKKFFSPAFSRSLSLPKPKKKYRQSPPTCLNSELWPPTDEKTEGTSPSGGHEATAQWLLWPPYPCAMTRHG